MIVKRHEYAIMFFFLMKKNVKRAFVLSKITFILQVVF